MQIKSLMCEVHKDNYSCDMAGIGQVVRLRSMGPFVSELSTACNLPLRRSMLQFRLYSITVGFAGTKV